MALNDSKYVLLNRWTVSGYELYNAAMAKTLNVIYVVNDQEQLIDDLRITELIVASEDQVVPTLMDESFPALHVFEDQEEAVKMLAKYDE